jgi:hypothetical protein
MLECRSEPLRRRLLEVTKYTIHAAHVDRWLLTGDLVCSAPELLVPDKPGLLILRE